MRELVPRTRKANTDGRSLAFAGETQFFKLLKK